MVKKVVKRRKPTANRLAARKRWREYREARERATPAWADLDAIKAIYAASAALSKRTRKRHHVDHVIPLRGKTVCGFHVENNLQIITKKANMAKGNKFE